METSWTHQLEQWHEFYLLCGTAGVTLTGVLFIVISLGLSIIAEQNTTGVKAFITPNIVYFASVLVVSNTLLAPVPREFVGWLMCAGAPLSMLYLWSVKGPQRWRENGLSVLDWIWYIALPYLAYALALLTGIGVLRDDPRALPALAADLVFLMLIGIRNAWDLAVWMPQQERKPGQPDIGAERARRSSPASSTES
jgi:hypothetical protein